MVQPRLKPFEGPDSAGKQRYDPMTITVKLASQYNPDEFGFEELAGFWNWPKGDALPKTGQKFRVWLATKPKTGPKAKPGSVYQDVVKAIPVIVEGENEYVDLGPGAPPPDNLAPDTRDHVDEAPAARSPLAGQAVPAEWTMPIEYWMDRHAKERVSIETQVAFKGLIELYGHMLAHAELVDPANLDDTLTLTKELAARLGRVEWPTPKKQAAANDKQGDLGWGGMPPATAENTRPV